MDLFIFLTLFIQNQFISDASHLPVLSLFLSILKYKIGFNLYVHMRATILVYTKKKEIQMASYYKRVFMRNTWNMNTLQLFVLKI